MKSNFFQAFLIGAFLLFAGLGILIFSGVIKLPGSGAQTITGSVVVWGTFAREGVQPLIDDLNQTNKTFKIYYIQKSAATYDQDLVEAIASGQGPDLVFLNDTSLARQANKLYQVPYDTIPAQTFLDTYVDEGQLFLGQNGAYAIPLFIDPLILYYNRDMLSAAGYTAPPKYWSDLNKGYVTTLTNKDDNDVITQSAIALGEFDNVRNSKAILTSLFMQLGSPVIAQKLDQNTKPPTLSYIPSIDSVRVGSAATALKFYTDFANPAKDVYTWNKTLPDSQDAFTSERSALYIGLASELSTIQAKNSRLNFNVAQVPQIDAQGALTMTYGKAYGVAALKSAPNLAGALYTQTELTDRTNAYRLSYALGLTPARKDLLANIPSNAFLPVIYKSAIIARSFYDPNPSETYTIFKTMVSDVISGRLSASDAVTKANKSLEDLLR